MSYYIRIFEVSPRTIYRDVELLSSAGIPIYMTKGKGGGKRVEFHYHSSKGNMERIVEPMKLCFKGQSWYLYAYCTVRKDYRFFKLRRMKELKSLNQHFERSCHTKIFGDSKVFQDNFVTITLKLSKKMAYRVYDEFSQYEVLSDGSFCTKLTMPKGNWIYHYLATFGEHCEVLEPEDIRLQVRDKLQKTLIQYL